MKWHLTDQAEKKTADAPNITDFTKDGLERFWAKVNSGDVKVDSREPDSFLYPRAM